MKNFIQIVVLTSLISSSHVLMAMEPAVIGPKEGTNYSASGGMNDQYVKLTSEQTNRLFTLTEDNMKQGIKVPLHKHLWHDETFYVTKGTIHYTVGDQVYEATSGTTVFVPRNTPHSLEIKGPDSSHIMISTPGGYDERKIASANLTPEQRKDKDFMKMFTIESDFFLVE